MDPPSREELRSLARAEGIAVADGEIDALRDEVAAMLDGADRVGDLSPDAPVDLAGRRWHTPADDPLNAVVTACDVPPTGAGILDDVTVGVKDIIAVAGVPMQCGSRAWRGFVPRRDATVVSRLLAAGATVTAKTNLDELATSGRGTTGAAGRVVNPHDAARTAGGSSGGSAAAVATGQVDVALGTDTAGSVQGPASYCGVVGVKPTHGLVPLSGVVEHAYTLDHVGVFASDVPGAARCLEAIAGRDGGDPASLQAAGRRGYAAGGYADATADPPGPDDLAVGVVEEGYDGVHDDVAAATERAVDRLDAAGVTVDRVTVSDWGAAEAIGGVLSFTELLAQWRANASPARRGGTVDEGFQAAFARRMAAGSPELGVYYKAKVLAGAALHDHAGGWHNARAQAARDVLADACEDRLADVDVLVTPTKPTTAPRFDAFPVDAPTARNTRVATVTRLPAVTIPGATAADGLPVGLQLLGSAFGERALLAAATGLDRALPAGDD